MSANYSILKYLR